MEIYNPINPAPVPPEPVAPPPPASEASSPPPEAVPVTDSSVGQNVDVTA
ncbi:MAG: hypothetical protein SNJ78_11820 [Spirochaetales bacterium]